MKIRTGILIGADSLWKCAIHFLVIFATGSAEPLFAQWEADRRLSVTDSAAFTNENMGPCLVAAGDTVQAVWYDAKNYGSAIYAKRSLDAGATWNSEMRLSGTPGHADFPSLSRSGAYLHLVFRDNRGGRNVSAYKRSTDGGATWEPDVVLDTAYWWPSVSSAGPLVCVALNDTLGSGNSEVYFRRSTDNGAHWEAIQRISDAPGRSEDPAIATDGLRIHLVWNDNRGGIMQSFYRRSTDAGATWGPETRLSFSTVMAYSPMVALNDAHVEVVWEDRRSGIWEIYRRHSADFGATWESEERLTTHATGAGYLYPFIARDGAKLHLVWFGDYLYYLRSGRGGAVWELPLRLVDSAGHPARPFVAVAGSAVHLIWSDARSGHSSIYYKRDPTGNVVTTGIAADALSDPADPFRFSAAPNPFTRSTRIPGGEDQNFILYDMFGRMLRVYAGSSVGTDLPAGMYILKPARFPGKPFRILKLR